MYLVLGESFVKQPLKPEWVIPIHRAYVVGPST